MNFPELEPSDTPDALPPGETDISPEQWQGLDALWKSILGLEASIDGYRLGMSGQLSAMEAEFRRTLTAEVKQHASQADLGQWNAAKSRLHYALPKAREFVHRATWAATMPERKQAEELVRVLIEPRDPRLDVGVAREDLQHLLKARQVLLAQGTAVSQECRSLTAEAQRTLNTLQRNAADAARKKRGTKR